MESRPQASEKITGIDSQGANSVASLLDDNRGQPQGANHFSVEPEIPGMQTPRTGGILFGGIITQGNDEKLRLELLYSP